MNKEGSGVSLKQNAIAKKEGSQTEKRSLPSKKRGEPPCNNVRSEKEFLQQDKELYQVIRQILSQKESKKNQQKAVNTLLKLIPYLSGIKKHVDPQISYEEAFNLALENVWQNINTFPKVFNLDLDNANEIDVRTCFVKWFNKILKRRIFDLYRQNKRQPFSCEQYPTQSTENHLSTDIGYLGQLANQEWLDRLRDYLQRDPEGILQDHPKGYPQCTCQELIQRRLLREVYQKWQEIATELHLPKGTVTAFWYRTCLPILQQIPEKLE